MVSEPQDGGARSVGVQDTARQPGRGRPASARRAAVGAAGERDRGELRIEDAVVEYATAGGATIRAVDGVTLTIAPGEIVALLGASGSGKSSLLRAIAGLEPLAGGRIAWDGEDVGRLPVHRRGFGLMFQEPVLFPNLDVGANVAYGLDRMPRRGSDRRAATVERMLELVGLPGYARRKVTELSGGQAQRVALARSLAPGPRLMLLDEPLSALDRALREHMVGVLGEVLRATGTPAVHVTHDQDEAFAIADRVAVLAEGRLLQIGAPGVLWRRPRTREVAEFLGYDVFLTDTDAEAFGATGLGVTGDVALGPASLVVARDGELGVEVPVRDQHVRRGYVEAVVGLPGGGEAEVRVPDLVQGETVRVRLDADAVALVGERH